jgi:hypothetical protein
MWRSSYFCPILIIRPSPPQFIIKYLKIYHKNTSTKKHFFRISEVRDRALSLMSVPLHKTIYVRILGYEIKNEVRKLREFAVNLTPKAVCGLAWNVLSCQNIEHEVLYTKGRGKILQTSKRISEVSLTLSHKSCGRTVLRNIIVRHSVHCAKGK